MEAMRCTRTASALPFTRRHKAHPCVSGGLLVKGKLNITVLAEEHCMNRWRYAWIIKHRFPDWLDGCDKIV